MFRKRGREDCLLFYIHSWGTWKVSHAARSGDDWQTLKQGYSSEIDVDNPILNRIEVFYVGEVAILYVNDRLLGVADINSVSGSGDV